MKMLRKALILAMLLLFSYFLGRSHCQVDTVIKEVEVVKYVKFKQEEILSRPNASKLKLLELMRSGEL